MTLFVGDYVKPQRIYTARHRPPLVSDFLVDAAGRRTSLGRVIEPLPVETATFFVQVWDRTKSAFVPTPITGVLIYRLLVWDIDAQALVEESYPESRLDAASFGAGSALQYDGDALPTEVLQLLAASRLG